MTRQPITVWSCPALVNGSLKWINSSMAGKEEGMQATRLVIVTGLCIIAGAATAAVADGARAEVPRCTNTYCEPLFTKCYEWTNWDCELDEGCIGSFRCDT